MRLNDYAWLAEAAERLPSRLPAGLLLYGQRGIGKHLLAEALGQSVLCREPEGNGRPCGRCEDCHLFEVGNHPDFRVLRPESEAAEGAAEESAKTAKTKKPSTRIGVDAVRDLAGLITHASHRGGPKVVLITAAEALHVSAGNALLKMLEEPGPETYFMLVANEMNRVLPTIRSRCFQLPVKIPDAAVAAAWLKQHDVKQAETALSLASSAPLAALRLSEDEQFWASREAILRELGQARPDPLVLATAAEKLPAAQLGRLLATWVYDLLALQQGAEARYHTDMTRQLAPMTKRLAARDLCHWADAVRDFTRAADHPLNPKLALESLFAQWPGVAG